MHRNTLLLTILLAVVAATLIGFNVGRRLASPSTSVTPTPTPASETALLTFTSEPCGITFAYPSRLEKLDGASGSAVFTDPSDETNGVVVTCQADIPRPPIVAERIEKVALTTADGATFSANLYHDATPKDGTPIDELIFTHPTTGLDVYLAGIGEVFNQILGTLRIL
jgi:hypothetical protein